MRTVLHHFEYATEATLLIAHSKVDDVEEHFRLVNPELSLVLFAITELLYNLLNDVHALTWVAVRYLSTDDILRPWEDAVVSIRIELHQLVLVYEGDVDWQVLIDEVDLL